MLIKNFKIWIGDMFALLIFSHHRTATYAAKCLFGKEVREDESYLCDFHNMLMNQNSFAAFLQSYANNNTIMIT